MPGSLSIAPHELYFPPPHHSHTATNIITLMNKSDSHCIFKIKVADPAKYYVKPTVAIAGPKAASRFSIALRQLPAPLEDPKAYFHNEKFKIIGKLLPKVLAEQPNVNPNAVWKKIESQPNELEEFMHADFATTEVPQGYNVAFSNENPVVSLTGATGSTGASALRHSNSANKNVTFGSPSEIQAAEAQRVRGNNADRVALDDQVRSLADQKGKLQADTAATKRRVDQDVLDAHGKGTLNKGRKRSVFRKGSMRISTLLVFMFLFYLLGVATKKYYGADVVRSLITNSMPPSVVGAVTKAHARVSPHLDRASEQAIDSMQQLKKEVQTRIEQLKKNKGQPAVAPAPVKDAIKNAKDAAKDAKESTKGAHDNLKKKL